MLLLRTADQVGTIPPPPGVEANFVDPLNLEHVIWITNSVLSFVSSCFLAFRLYTTWYITRSAGVDDFMITLAWVLACIASGLDCLLTRYGLGLHLWNVPFSTFNIHFIKISAICGIFYGLSIMFCKLSILVLFLRYMPYKPSMIIYATMGIVVLYSFVTAFGWVFACRPVEKFWDLTITNGSCVDWGKVNIFSGIMNTATDTIILILPIVMLQKIRLPMWEKIGVLIALMTGGFVLILSIIRLKTTIDMADNLDITWEFVHNGIWWMVEMHSAIVCACLLIGRAFLRKHTSLIRYNFSGVT